jgi:hypothetical protein
LTIQGFFLLALINPKTVTDNDDEINKKDKKIGRR